MQKFLVKGYKVLQPFQCDPDIMVGRYSYLLDTPQEMNRHGKFYVKLEEALKTLGEFDTLWEVEVDKINEYDDATGIGKAKIFVLKHRWSDKQISEWFLSHSDMVKSDKDLWEVSQVRCYMMDSEAYDWDKVPKKFLEKGLYFYTGLDLSGGIKIPVNKDNTVFAFLNQMIGHMIVCQEIGLHFCNRRIYAVRIDGDSIAVEGVIHFRDVLPMVYRNWKLLDLKKVQWKKSLPQSIIEDPEGEISAETIRLAKEISVS